MSVNSFFKEIRHIPKLPDLASLSFSNIIDLPEFVYVHEWKNNDLIMWDNRQTMHRVRYFDDTREFRDMRRTTVEGNNEF